MGWIYLALITAGLISLISWNLRRSQEKIGFELKPNCLITKYPIVFIEGRKSIFYFLSYWNTLPDFLAQHGYDVIEYDLHWRNDKKRTKQLRDFLDEADTHNVQSSPAEAIKYHLVIDRSSLREVQNLFEKESFSSVASCTLVTNRSSFFTTTLKHPIEDVLSNKASSPFTLKLAWLLHRFWTQSWETDPVSLNINVGASEDQKNKISQLQESMLERAVLLAERDLLLNSSTITQHLNSQPNSQQGKKQHDDESSTGIPRNPVSTQDLPPTSR